MSDYVLQVNYHRDEEPLRITLHGYSPDDAETAHQALETEVEHAKTMNAPVMFSAATDDDPTAGVPIDPARVTGINLIAPAPSE
jgi:hypothetical protein